MVPTRTGRAGCGAARFGAGANTVAVDGHLRQLADSRPYSFQHHKSVLIWRPLA
jgi:hypothetical protein